MSLGVALSSDASPVMVGGYFWSVLPLMQFKLHLQRCVAVSEVYAFGNARTGLLTQKFPRLPFVTHHSTLIL